jgi:hypothetical protein
MREIEPRTLTALEEAKSYTCRATQRQPALMATKFGRQRNDAMCDNRT